MEGRGGGELNIKGKGLEGRKTMRVVLDCKTCSLLDCETISIVVYINLIN